MMHTTKTSALARDMRHVADDIERLLKDSNGATRHLKERMSEALDGARHRFDGLNTGARQALAATDQYVHQSPWQAVGIGMAIGLAAGLVLMMRR